MRGAPQRGLARLIFRIRFRTSGDTHGRPSKMATLPIPIQSKPLAMPGDDRLRLDKEQCRAPIVPQSRKPDPQDTVSPTETQPTPTARTLQDQKLMPECKNLCLQNSASSETISQREEYGQHGLGRPPVATL